MSDCNANVTKGKELVLLARNDGDTAWEIIGGVKDRGYTIDNPVEDTTSSSTTGDYADSEFTGYSQMTLNLSGNADERTGEVDPSTGFTIVGSVRLQEIATSANRCGKFQMLNVDTGGTLEGFFNVTSYSRTGSTPGLLAFDATLQSKSDVTLLGEV
jgi:predicted secreted protein